MTLKTMRGPFDDITTALQARRRGLKLQATCSRLFRGITWTVTDRQNASGQCDNDQNQLKNPSSASHDVSFKPPVPTSSNKDCSQFRKRQIAVICVRFFSPW